MNLMYTPMPIIRFFLLEKTKDKMTHFMSVQNGNGEDESRLSYNANFANFFYIKLRCVQI